jgi:stearoyl-CoA desaturase (delta-9 desaturase)
VSANRSHPNFAKQGGLMTQLDRMQSSPTSDSTLPSAPATASKRMSFFSWLWSQIDSSAITYREVGEPRQQTSLKHWVPFIILHAGCLGVIWVGWSWFAVGVAAALYLLRMFAITAFYHRYFSHRSYRTSRWAQFAFALWGNTAVQRGPIWWASHHRQHHAHSDGERDFHSPHTKSLLWSHIGWLTAPDNLAINPRYVRDWMQFPELRFLDRFDTLVPIVFAVLLFGLGVVLNSVAPQLGTNGMQMLVWGFFISTTLLFHGTCCINSFAHVIGRRRFKTKDKSRNSLLLAMITLGEGWHNNHHHCQFSARQGFYWWEIDISYYGLLLLRSLGIIWEVKSPPAKCYDPASPTREAAA